MTNAYGIFRDVTQDTIKQARHLQLILQRKEEEELKKEQLSNVSKRRDKCRNLLVCLRALQEKSLNSTITFDVSYTYRYLFIY
jgi:hypothetical protein